MRIALISDIHGNVHGLEAVLDDLKNQDIDRTVCLGDVVGYYPFVNETIECLRENRITCILGNHDAVLTEILPVSPQLWADYRLDHAKSVIEPDNLLWLKSLPSSENIDAPEGTIACYHGSPWNPLTEYVYLDHDAFARFEELDTTYVALGHTHWPFTRRVGSTTIVNPGSCGQPRDYIPGACYALIDTETARVSLKRLDYDIDRFAQTVRSAGIKDELISILYRERQPS